MVLEEVVDAVERDPVQLSLQLVQHLLRPEVPRGGPQQSRLCVLPLLQLRALFVDPLRRLVLFRFQPRRRLGCTDPQSHGSKGR
jgi:hypothetical protein